MIVAEIQFTKRQTVSQRIFSTSSKLLVVVSLLAMMTSAADLVGQPAPQAAPRPAQPLQRYTQRPMPTPACSYTTQARAPTIQAFPRTVSTSTPTPRTESFQSIKCIDISDIDEEEYEDGPIVDNVRELTCDALTDCIAAVLAVIGGTCILIGCLGGSVGLVSGFVLAIIAVIKPAAFASIVSAIVPCVAMKTGIFVGNCIRVAAEVGVAGAVLSSATRPNP